MLDEKRNNLKDIIRVRTENHVGDWTPFVENVEDLLTHIDELSSSIDELKNEIGETQGMVKNLRKILIKLEVIDDRFIF
jgi:peptidoglycan hydrolase CwlO-like protein